MRLIPWPLRSSNCSPLPAMVLMGPGPAAALLGLGAAFGENRARAVAQDRGLISFGACRAGCSYSGYLDVISTSRLT